MARTRGGTKYWILDHQRSEISIYKNDHSTSKTQQTTEKSPILLVQHHGDQDL